MISFMDKTFCAYFDTCKKGEKCERALTEKVKRDAATWWGDANAPICIYAEHPDCYREKK